MVLPLSLLSFQAVLVAGRPPEALLRLGLPATILAAIPFLALFIRLRGVRLILVGLGLNLSVILANGGLMPVTPDTVALLMTPERQAELVVGQPIERSKDVLLEPADVRLAGLRDRFVARAGPLRTVYSLGDVLVMAGLAIVLVELAGALHAELAFTKKATPGVRRPGAAV